MKVDKMSVSFEAALGDEIRRAARSAGVGLSSWLAQAASARLRADALREFLDTWEGVLTPDDLARAEAELGQGGARRVYDGSWTSGDLGELSDRK